MAFPKFRLLETVNKPTTAAPTRTNLPLTEVIKKLILRVVGTCTLDSSADGVLTPESVLSLIRTITVEASSSARKEIGKIKYADTAAMYYLNQFLRGTPSTLLNPTPITKSSAASPFNFHLPIDFQMLFSQDPRQTLLNTTELTALALILDWGDYTDMFSAGVVTYPSCSVQIYADEFIDPESKAVKYALNQFSFIEVATTSSNSRQAIDLKRGYILRGFMIKQATKTAYPHTPVETVINTVSLELNREVKFKADFQTCKDQNKAAYQMVTVPTGYTFVDLMPESRYDTVIDTRQYRDVNVILDVTGVANSFVRVYPVEMIPATL
jgi:hypothetical protein